MQVLYSSRRSEHMSISHGMFCAHFVLCQVCTKCNEHGQLYSGIMLISCGMLCTNRNEHWQSQFSAHRCLPHFKYPGIVIQGFQSLLLGGFTRRHKVQIGRIWISVCHSVPGLSCILNFWGIILHVVVEELHDAHSEIERSAWPSTTIVYSPYLADLRRFGDVSTKTFVGYLANVPAVSLHDCWHTEAYQRRDLITV